MVIQISRTESEALWQQTNPLPKRASCEGLVETLEYVPPQLGKGYIQRIQWHEIELLLFNYTFHDDVHVVGLPQTACISREFGFNLSGNRCGKNSGENFFEWVSIDDQDEEFDITHANDPILKVDIHLESVNSDNLLIAGMLETLPINARRCIEDDNPNEFSEINVITPAMRLALEQTLHCPFQGWTKKMYLESKCLELIALKIEQIKEMGKTSNVEYSLSSDDIERIYAAKEILVTRPDRPPSLMTLSRQVGLNDFKLKVGFKEVFGTTVFGYLYQHRMEMARQLLNQGSLKVKDVAQMVGYASPSRFSTAFRKQFGVNPKAYHLRKKSR